MELAELLLSSIIFSLQLIKGSFPSPFFSNDASSPSWCSEGGKGKKDLQKENTEGPPRGGTAVVARIRCEGGRFWNARSYLPFSTRICSTKKWGETAYFIPTFPRIDSAYQEQIKYTEPISGQCLPTCVWSFTLKILPGPCNFLFFFSFC